MADKIQIRRDTAANWTSSNPTLAAGELGYETDTDKIKMGDGSTAWTAPLSYWGYATLDLIGDVTITSNSSGEILKWSGSAWINQTLAEAGIQPAPSEGAFANGDKTKLDAIEASATADQSNAEIRAAVEAATDSNVFTDADHTKLNAISGTNTGDEAAASLTVSGVVELATTAETTTGTDTDRAVTPAGLVGSGLTTGRLVDVQVFTSSGTYTPHADAKMSLVVLTAAGGGGGCADSSANGTDSGAGGGGAAGGTIWGYVDVSGGSYTSTITIGALGAGGTGGSAGSQGGDSVYADGTVTWTAGGGNGGGSNVDRVNDRATQGGAHSSNTASGAEFHSNGQSGTNGYLSGGGGAAFGGTGGSSYWGGGAQGEIANSGGDSNAGANAFSEGAGGGGAATRGNATAADGGDGGAGHLIIYEFSE